MRTLVSLAVATVLLVAVPAAANAAEGNLLVGCTYDHTAPDDPILAPGVTGGSTHQHAFFGARGINAFTSTVDLLAKPHTCNFASENVGIWHPQLIKTDGTAVDPDVVAIYYRNPAGASNPVYPIPMGLRFVAGNAHNHDGKKVSAAWACGTGTFTNRIPGAACTTYILEQFHTSQCWDGKKLDAPGHRTLVPCTGDNIRLPALLTTFKWPAGSGGGRLESDIDEGVSGGVTAHYDYWFAGDPFAWAKVVERCLNKGIQCRPVTNAFTKWPINSVADVTNLADTPVLSAAEARGLNPG